MKRVKAKKLSLTESVKRHIEAIGVVVGEVIAPGTITIHYPRERRKLPDNFRGLILFDNKTCISCFRCAHICPANAIIMEHRTAYFPSIDYAKCIFCHFCVDSCPVGALKPTKIHDFVYKDMDEMVVHSEEMVETPEIVREDRFTVEYIFDGEVQLVKRKEVDELVPEIKPPERPSKVAAAVSPENCISCRLCVAACPTFAISAKEEKTKITLEINPERCTACSICNRICPTSTLGLVDRGSSGGSG